MKKAKYYRDLFTEIYNNGDEILNNTTKEVFNAEVGEEFAQCWADTVTRRCFPKYWFISKKGNLLSVKKDKIVWLHKNKRENSNKISYKFAIETENGTQIRNVEEHNLVGLVWGSECFGLAAELLEEKGIDAFGVNSKGENKVQGHHKKDDTNNSPDNVKFMTDKVHITLENAPDYADTDEKHLEYMEKLGRLMEQENPNGITVVFTGDVYDKRTGAWSNTGESDIFSTDKITISPYAAAQLKLIASLI